MSLFALHSEMTFATSLDGPQRLPEPSTTRTVLAPRALMSANAWVLPVYHTCGWLTPRMMNCWPLASTMLRPLTWRPTAADASWAYTTNDAATTASAAPNIVSLRFMGYFSTPRIFETQSKRFELPAYQRPAARRG